MEEFSYAGPKSYDMPGKNLVFPKIKIDDISLGPVYEFVCISFRTDNLNCFRAS